MFSTLWRCRYHDGKYFLTEHTEDQQRETAKVRAEELEWARNRLEVLPSLPHAELDRDAKQVADLVGLRAIAPTLAASGADLPLLSDDFGIRIWSKATVDVDGVWLQPVLMMARDEGHLSDEEFADAVLAMVDAGFSYVSLDNRTLSHALRKAEFDVTVLSKPLKILLGKSADINRNLLIAIAVMLSLRDEDCPPSQSTVWLAKLREQPSIRAGRMQEKFYWLSTVHQFQPSANI